MSKKMEYKGNDYVDATIHDHQISRDEMSAILNFIKTHQNVYLYGKGMCGHGFKEYCDICSFTNIRGFVTSDMADEFISCYKPKRDGIILTLRGDYYPEIMSKIWGKINLNDILFLKEKTKTIFIRSFSDTYLSENMWITLPLTKHCNVNCASCSMFSPICEKEMYRLEDVRQDVEKLKMINISFSRINISGGEPFLNPELPEILEYLRRSYPTTGIDVYTNGLLAKGYSEEKLRRISRTEALFKITDYELNKNVLDSVYKSFDSFGIGYQVNYDGKDKVYFKKKIDFNGDVPVYEFINCQHYTFAFSFFLFKGIIYKCPLALSAETINQFFDKKIEITDEDYLNVHSVNTPKEIRDFLRRRHPMCSYCPPVTETVPWHISERCIEEWT